jgi:hypothetical protein
VFNDSSQRRTVVIRLEGEAPASSREQVTGKTITWKDGATTLTLDGGEVAVVTP